VKYRLKAVFLDLVIMTSIQSS